MNPNQKPQRQFFDISHPHQRPPSPTSKPIIVGHQPQAADPMVNQRPSAPTDQVSSLPPELHHDPIARAEHQIHDEPASMPPPVIDGPKPQPPAGIEDHDDDNTKMHWLVWASLGLISLLVALYLLIDAGVIAGASHLPFHIFKQPEPAAQTTSNDQTNSTTPDQAATTSQTQQRTISHLQDGFSFSYPSDWSIVAYKFSAGQKTPTVVDPASTDASQWLIAKKNAGVADQVNDACVFIKFADLTDASLVNQQTWFKQGGQILTLTDNGLRIWQRNDAKGRGALAIATKPKGGYYIDLPDNKGLAAYTSFDCGQGMTTTYTYKQQVDNADYKTGIDILKSISLN